MQKLPTGNTIHYRTAQGFIPVNLFLYKQLLNQL